MVEELPEGVKLGWFKRVTGLGIKYKTIAEMDHGATDRSLSSKRIVYRKQLKAAHAGALQSDEEVRQRQLALKKQLKAQKKLDRAKGVGWSERRQDYKEAILTEKVEVLKNIVEETPEHIDAFVVSEYERALFLQMGKMVDVVPPGTWEMDQNYNQTGTEIIWIDMTEFQFKWGFFGLMSSDFAKLGVSGESTLRVRDPRALLMSILSSKDTLNQAELEEYVRTTMENVIRVSLGRSSVDQLMRERGLFEAQVRAEMSGALERWGLDIVGLEVRNFKLPPEFEDLYKDLMKDGVADRRQDITKKAIGRDADLQKTELGAGHDVNLLKHQQDEQMALMGDDTEIARLRKETEKRKLLRQMKQEDAYADLDVDEARGMSGAKVDGAKINAKANYELEMKRMEMNKEVMVAQAAASGQSGRLDREDRQTADGYKRDVGVSQGGFNRDLSVAQAGAVNINSGLGQPIAPAAQPAGGGKLASLEAEKKDLEGQIAKLDNFLMEGKMSQDMYERRVNMIMNQIEDVRREILSLKRL
jgi:SPFH domain/Band 7 family protein